MPLILPSPLMADALQGQASIVDGDTLEIHGTRFRLFGIDAPKATRPVTTTTADSIVAVRKPPTNLRSLLVGRPCPARRATSINSDGPLRFASAATSISPIGWCVRGSRLIGRNTPRANTLRRRRRLSTRVTVCGAANGLNHGAIAPASGLAGVRQAVRKVLFCNSFGRPAQPNKKILDHRIRSS